MKKQSLSNLSTSFFLFAVIWMLAGAVLTGASYAQSMENKYVEMLGIREFSRRLIARPVQPEAWRGKGLSDKKAAEQTAMAKTIIEKCCLSKVKMSP